MAVVLMVKPDDAAASAPPQHLLQAFAAHELIVASSIDEALEASTRHTPDLILMSAALLPGGEQALLDEASGEPRDDRRTPDAHVAGTHEPPRWFYWFTKSRTSPTARTMGPQEFLELARRIAGRQTSRTT